MFGCDLKTGGESGIRTHVTLSSKHAFQACAFSHSAISPAKALGRTIDFRRAIVSCQVGSDSSQRSFVSFYVQGRTSANRWYQRNKDGCE